MNGKPRLKQIRWITHHRDKILLYGARKEEMRTSVDDENPLSQIDLIIQHVANLLKIDIVALYYRIVQKL